MARTEPSTAQLALADATERRGAPATPTQIERWQGRAWLPKPSTWFQPDASMIRPEILDRAVWLASTAKAGRSIGWLGWYFWAKDSTPDTAHRLRAALTDALKRSVARAGVEELPTGNSNRAFQARQNAATRLAKRRAPRRDLDGLLRAGATGAGIDLPRSPAAAFPNIFHRALLNHGAHLMLGGAADVPFEDMLQAWEQASPDNAEMIDHIRQMCQQAQLSGVDLMAQSPMANGLAGMLQTIEQADDQALCRAVHTCIKAAGTLPLLLQHAEHEPDILVQLMGDVMWDQWVRFGGIAPDGAAGATVTAISVFTYLAMPDWAADLDRYLTFMGDLRASHSQGCREIPAPQPPTSPGPLPTHPSTATTIARP